MNQLQELKIPKDKESLIYYGLAAFSLLLLLISLIFRLNVALTPKEEPIVPVNQKPSTSRTKDSTVTTNESTTEATKNSSSTTETKDSKKEEEMKPPTKQDKKNIILTAKEDNSESFEGESIKTYTIDKPIEEEGLSTIVTGAVVAKLSKESMADIGHKGEGLIDVNLEMENKSEHDVTIYPEEVTFTYEDKEYPVTIPPDLKNSALKKGETKDLTLQLVLPKLKNSDAVKEISFTWKTTTNKIDQEYDVLIVLK